MANEFRKITEAEGIGISDLISGQSTKMFWIHCEVFVPLTANSFPRRSSVFFFDDGGLKSSGLRITRLKSLDLLAICIGMMSGAWCVGKEEEGEEKEKEEDEGEVKDKKESENP